MNTQPKLQALQDELERIKAPSESYQYLTGYIHGWICLAYECGRIDGRDENNIPRMVDAAKSFGIDVPEKGRNRYE